MKRKTKRKRDVASQAIRNILMFLDDEISATDFRRFNDQIINSLKSQMSLELENSPFVKRFG